MASLTVTDRFNYDVFLSFRGEDTRYGFTGNLKKALDNQGVRTFMDEKDLEKGNEITPSLLKAIEDSMMAIVVLSKNYASSSFCLQELLKILDTMKDKVGRIVLPVFYKVDPSDIRKLKTSFGEAMEKHKASSYLDKWKVSLHQVADLSGFHYKGNEYEHEFIRKIVEKVSKMIKPVELHVSDCLVGLKDKVQDVISRLNIGSDDTIHMVGIHGIGGIGKTTLALLVCNSIAHQFQGFSFLENVRENSNNIDGLRNLQKNLLKQIFGEDFDFTNYRKGISILQQRLPQKKVLLLLDDVDNKEQLEAIAGRPDWFGPGSRIIITTRDKRLLTCHGVKKTYEVKGLNDEDAFVLVGCKAFKNNNLSYRDLKNDEVFSGYVDVLMRAIAYASGLPLALEVIGSHFFNKTIEECNHALDRCERVPHEKIQKVLRWSFDTLQEEEKFVFLDIACCFKGYKLKRVEQILHSHHGDIMKDHITVLAEKSLIKISESGIVTLHDLIKDMGKDIVRQESRDPGKRSRLWASKDIKNVLKENKGTSKIEMIRFNGWKISQEEWDGEAFKKMENLKTLIVNSIRLEWRYPSSDVLHEISFIKSPLFSNDVDFSKPPKHLPNSMIMVECHDISPGFLVGIPIEWKDSFCLGSEWNVTKDIRDIRILKFDRVCLAQLPDISSLSKLEQFSIHSCKELIAINESVGFLGKLKILRIISCTQIQSVPPLNFASLEELDLSHCSSLESFPLMVNCFVGELKILKVIGCNKIRIIPYFVLASLEELDLSECTSLESFSHVVDVFGDKLKTMSVRRCIKLRSIPPLKLDLLETLDLSYCHSLENFPVVVDGSLGKLKTLLVESCHNVKSIPPFKLDLVETLDLSCCYSLDSFPFVMDGLWKLVLDDCKELQEIKVIPPCLRILSALNCMSLTSSCKSKLLNQELHEAGNTWFRLPQAKVPEWFDHQCSAGLSISFWFRNKFPAIALCVLSPLTWDGSPLRVIINDNTFLYAHDSKIGAKSHADTYHLHLFHMQMENFNDNMDKALFESKWNHAEVYFGFEFHESGIHVLKEKSNMKDVRFTNPENDANIVITRDEVMLPPEPFNLPTELSLTSEEIEPLPNNLHLSSSSIRHISHKNVSNQTEQIQCLSSSEKFLDNQESKAHGRKLCTLLFDYVSNLNAQRGDQKK